MMMKMKTMASFIAFVSLFLLLARFGMQAEALPTFQKTITDDGKDITVYVMRAELNSVGDSNAVTLADLAATGGFKVNSIKERQPIEITAERRIDENYFKAMNDLNPPLTLLDNNPQLAQSLTPGALLLRGSREFEVKEIYIIEKSMELNEKDSDIMNEKRRQWAELVKNELAVNFNSLEAGKKYEFIFGTLGPRENFDVKLYESFMQFRMNKESTDLSRLFDRIEEMEKLEGNKIWLAPFHIPTMTCAAKSHFVKINDKYKLVNADLAVTYQNHVKA